VAAFTWQFNWLVKDNSVLIDKLSLLIDYVVRIDIRVLQRQALVELRLETIHAFSLTARKLLLMRLFALRLVYLHLRLLEPSIVLEIDAKGLRDSLTGVLIAKKHIT